MSLGAESKLNEAYERKLMFEKKKSGHKFIAIAYIGGRSEEELITYEVSGVETLKPLEGYENNKKVFKFSISGGSIKFVSDRMYGDYPVCNLLDTPFNRKFLATHYNPNVWEIIEDDIDAQIRGLRTKLINALKEPNEEDEKFQAQVAKLNNAIIGAEDPKDKIQLTNQLTNLVSSRGKKEKIEERKKSSIPKPRPIKQLRSQKQKKESSELVKVDEHK